MSRDKKKKSNKKVSENRKKENLLVLVYSSDRCHTILVNPSELELKADDMSGVNPQDLKINLKNKTWSFREYENVPIGLAREGLGRYNFSRWGVIGVYDQSNCEHIRELVLNAQDAVKTLPHGAYVSDDD